MQTQTSKLVKLFICCVISGLLLRHSLTRHASVQFSGERIQEELWHYQDSGNNNSFLGANCGEIWEEWSNVARQGPPETPPLTIPKELWKEYTLWGRVPVRIFYRNDKPSSKRIVWEDIDSQVNRSKELLISQPAYGTQTGALFNALTYYQEHVHGKSGLVIGSLVPWCEVFALHHGARELTTVDYQEIEIRTREYKMHYMHPLQMADERERFGGTFDFAISYSSIEHSGLGRYGDTLDPFGDLREVSKVRCLLKRGGLFFFAVPTGEDSIEWNVHRVYGTVRLPWLLRGFNLVGVFHNWNQTKPSLGIPYSLLTGPTWRGHHPVLVLEKQ